MKFRKLFVLLMMALVLAACGKTENSGNSKVESSTETSGGKKSWHNSNCRPHCS